MVAHRDLVIFDWDDTIFPSTALVGRMDRISKAEWAAFGEYAISLLATYIDAFGADSIYIVTDGSANWIRHSLEMMSKAHSISSRMKHLLLNKLRGRVISAKDRYEPSYPNQTSLWKRLVFTEIAIAHFGVGTNCSGTIISIGDGMDEYAASGETQKVLQSQYEMNPLHLIRILLHRAPTTQLMVKQFCALSQMTPIFLGNGIRSSFDVIVARYILWEPPQPANGNVEAVSTVNCGI